MSHPSLPHNCYYSMMNERLSQALQSTERLPLCAKKFIGFTFEMTAVRSPWRSAKTSPEMMPILFLFFTWNFLLKYKKEKMCVVFTCSSESWEMWFTEAYDSILGLKWFTMALKDKIKQHEDFPQVQ